LLKSRLHVYSGEEKPHTWLTRKVKITTNLVTANLI
jgi:hypothetical protein